MATMLSTCINPFFKHTSICPGTDLVSLIGIQDQQLETFGTTTKVYVACITMVDAIPHRKTKTMPLAHAKMKLPL